MEPLAVLWSELDAVLLQLRLYVVAPDGSAAAAAAAADETKAATRPIIITSFYSNYLKIISLK